MFSLTGTCQVIPATMLLGIALLLLVDRRSSRKVNPADDDVIIGPKSIALALVLLVIGLGWIFAIAWLGPSEELP